MLFLEYNHPVMDFQDLNQRKIFFLQSAQPAWHSVLFMENPNVYLCSLLERVGVEREGVMQEIKLLSFHAAS